MREIEIGDIAWSIADRCQNEDDVKVILALLAEVDYQTLMDKIEYERNQWKCGLCREFKDVRTFTYVMNKPRGSRICPECLTDKAIFCE